MHEAGAVKKLVVSDKVCATMIGRGRTYVRERVAAGDLDGRKMGKSFVITVASIEAFIERLPRVGEAAAPAPDAALAARAEKRVARREAKHADAA